MEDLSYRKFMSREELHKSLNTLVGIIKGIDLDHEISTAELDELKNWYDLHRHLLSVKPFDEIVPTLDSAMEDGVIDEDEAEDLLWLCDRFLDEASSKLYFDAVTSNLQQLHGLVHGIIADGKISDAELNGLKDWLDEHDDLAGCYPYDEIYSLLLAAKEDGVVTQDERNMLMAFFATFVDLRDSANLHAPNLTALQSEYQIGGVCAVAPEIIFEGRSFCFTGVSSRASRSEIERTILEHGGKFAKDVSKKVDYLVVGREGNPCWAYSCYGRKVEKVIDLRKQGHRIVIIDEIDFWDELVE